MTDQPEPVRRPVYAVKAPLPIDRLGELRPALEVLYGFDLTVESSAGVFIFYTPGRACDCLYCDRVHTDVVTPHRAGYTPMRFNMAVCAFCGSSSCEHARYHGATCTKEGDRLLAKLTDTLAHGWTSTDGSSGYYPTHPDPTKETP